MEQLRKFFQFLFKKNIEISKPRLKNITIRQMKILKKAHK